MVSKVFEHPFDLTKVRLQSQVLEASARFSGPVDCLVQTWQKEGISGLYRVRIQQLYSLLPLLMISCRDYQLQSLVQWQRMPLYFFPIDKSRTSSIGTLAHQGPNRSALVS